MASPAGTDAPPAARPARWRRGRRIGVVALAVVALAGLRWWTHPLRGLPDVGHPFDVDEVLRVEVADEDNAYVLYRRAVDLMTRMPRGAVSDEGGPAWGSASDEARAWVGENVEALDLWLRGADRPDALYIHPAELRFGTLLPVVQGLSELNHLARLEASRREIEGDLAGAWEVYRASLRSSRHVGRHGVAVERAVGAAIYRYTADRVVRWAGDPRVDAGMLREALADLRAADAMTTPASETLKVQYLMVDSTFEDPEFMRDPTGYIARVGFAAPRPMMVQLGPYQISLDLFIGRPSRRFRGEPERSRRLIRLAFANWLAYADVPPDRRPPVLDGPVRLYVPGPDATPAARAVPPDRIASGFEGALITSLLVDLGLFGMEPIPDEGEAESDWTKHALLRERDARARMEAALLGRLRALEGGPP